MKIHYLLSVLSLIVIPKETFCQNKALEKSLEPFIIATTSFLNTVQPDSGLYTVLNSLIEDGKLKQMNNDEYLEVFRKNAGGPYVGLVILFLIGFLFFITMPFIGLFFCCCRCCCYKCGGQVSLKDKKNSRCLRIAFTVLLLICCSIMLLGAVLACLSNEVIHDDVSADKNDLLSKGIKNTLSYADTFFAEFVTNLNGVLNKTISIDFIDSVKNLVETDIYGQITPTLFRKAGVEEILTNANLLVQKFALYEKEVNSTVVVAENHFDKASVFEDNLRELINRTVLHLGTDCPNDYETNKAQCEALTKLLNDVNVNFNYTLINYEIPKLLQEIITLVDSDSLGRHLFDFDTRLRNIGETVKNATKGDYDKAMEKISDSNYSDYFKSLNKTITDLRNVLTDFESTIFNTSIILGKSLEDGVSTEIDNYRYYAFYGFAALMLFLVLLVYIGLLYGVIGGRPYEDSSCCNKGVGANFYMAFIGFTFIFTWIWMLILMLLFFFGATVQNEVCRPLTSPDPKYANQLNDFVNLVAELGGNSTFPRNTVNALLVGCPNNRSLLDELDLSQTLNINDLFDKTAQPFIDDIKNSVSGSTTSFDTSSSDLQDILVKLGEVITNATQFNTLMQENVNGELSKTATTPNVDIPTVLDLYDSILGDTSSTSNFHKELTIMKNDFSTIVNESESLQKLFKSQYEILLQLQPEMKRLIDDVGPKITLISSALKTTKFTEMVSEIMDNFANKLRDLIKSTFANIVRQLGACSLFNKVFQTFDDTFCKILNHYNLFWCGIGICFLFLIPTMIFAGKLVSLYRKIQKYTTEYADSADYLTNQQFYGHENGMPLDKEYFLQRKKEKPFSDISSTVK